MRTFFAPWPGDRARYPAAALERHSAHCRALDLPDETHPSVVKPLLTAVAIQRGVEAVEMLEMMESWYPAHYDRTDTSSVRSNILVIGYRHYAFYGGRGGSKSHGAGEAVIELASTKYERVVCGREFMNSIRDSSRALLIQKIKASIWANDWLITDRELTNKKTGSLVTFLGINRNPDSARSLEGCTLFLGEEAEAFSETSLEILLPTIRSPGSRCLWLWNPSDRESPMNKMFIDGDMPERSFVRCVLSEDNAYFYRTTMPAERRSSWRKQSRAKFRHVWRGALDLNPELAVYTNWSVGRHPLEGDPEPRYGLDWGYQDPLAITEFFVFEPEDPEVDEGVIYVCKEIYGSYIPSREIPGRLEDTMPMARSHTITADSAEPKSIEDLNSAGFHVVGARKGPGSIRAGISLISGYKIVVSPDCPNTAMELAAYRWKTTRSGLITRDPVDEDNHLLDTLRYGMEDYQPAAKGKVLILF